MKRKLIVTADDFGADLDVNEAVERAHREGILTSASLLVGAPSAEDAVRRARQHPRLGVGLHVAVVDAAPTLPPDRIPHLVDPSGRLRSDLFGASLTFFAVPPARAQLRSEIRAQFERFAASGLALDHVDAHKHLQLHPTVAAATLDAGRGRGLRAFRVPAEPREPLRRADPRGAGSAAASSLLRPWIAVLRRRLRHAGIRTANRVFGLAWSGAMSEPRVLALLEHLPPGVSEIYFHPRLPRAERPVAEDFATLVSPTVRERVERLGIELTTYGALA